MIPKICKICGGAYWPNEIGDWARCLGICKECLMAVIELREEQNGNFNKSERGNIN